MQFVLFDDAFDHAHVVNRIQLECKSPSCISTPLCGVLSNVLRPTVLERTMAYGIPSYSSIFSSFAPLDQHIDFSVHRRESMWHLILALV